MTKFWMVFNTTTHGPTKVTYTTLDKAKQEAKRLALEYPHHRFAVLEAVLAYQLTTIHEEILV